MTDSRRSATGLELGDEIDRALATPAREESLVVDGVRIAYRVWDSPAAVSTLVLVHGGAAHSHWWDAVAPLLVGRDRVVAVDLSGHGDSERHAEYGVPLWAAEVAAVARHVAVGEVTLVGHSLGGLVSTHLATHSGQRFAGAIVVDSLINNAAGGDSDLSSFGSLGTRVYPTLDEAIGRFRPVPFQHSDPRIGAHVARLSVRAADGGWTWKFDPLVFGGPRFAAPPVGLTTRYAFIRAEHGLVPPSVSDLVRDAGGVYIELPSAGHAPMLDRPLALTAAIRSILTAWRQQPPT
jgi:pimeloyl-ACP methyl ester carboxylesterase